jgi:hypothetical protein
MVFSTHYCKSERLNKALRHFLCVVLMACAGWVQAQSQTEISQFKIERADDEVQLSAQMQFELPAAVEDALLKGIPMYFLVEAEIKRERWYWYDKRIAGAQRQLRVAYQPLTRRWRLNVNAGTGAGNVGLSLNQNFETLPEAMAIVKRVARWKIADVAEIDPQQKYKMDFRFRLDLSQLPRPFQIGALGQSEWEVAASYVAPLTLESLK